MSTGVSNPSPAAGPAARAGADSGYGSQRQIYEPHRVGLPPIGPYLREAWRRREFAIELSRTNLREQHYETLFGKFWLVLNPLLLSLIYFILLDFVRGGRS